MASESSGDSVEPGHLMLSHPPQATNAAAIATPRGSLAIRHAIFHLWDTTIPMNKHITLLVTLVAALAIACGSEGPASPTQPTPISTRTFPMQVEPSLRNTFGPGPGVTVPAGTTVFLRLVATGTPSPILLHRCGVPCDTATLVRRWEPGSFQTGDILSHQLLDEGRYYLWLRNDQGGQAFPSTSDSQQPGALRITFASGAVIDGWYTVP